MSEDSKPRFLQVLDFLLSYGVAAFGFSLIMSVSISFMLSTYRVAARPIAEIPLCICPEQPSESPPDGGFQAPAPVTPTPAFQRPPGV